MAAYALARDHNGRRTLGTAFGVVNVALSSRAVSEVQLVTRAGDDRPVVRNFAGG